MYCEKMVRRVSVKRALKVCILSPHPLVLAEFSRALDSPAFDLTTRQLESTLGPDLRKLTVPHGAVYVVDAAHATPPATAALIANILETSPSARLIVVAEKFSRRGQPQPAAAGRQGPADLRRSARANLPARCPWSPAVDSGCRDPCSRNSSIRSLRTSHGRRLKVDTATELSRREQEVLDALLENLANKEIASSFNISERTVKFHVSNLLSKVRRAPPCRPDPALLPGPPGPHLK